jgi:hypothetical protein
MGCARGCCLRFAVCPFRLGGNRSGPSTAEQPRAQVPALAGARGVRRLRADYGSSPAPARRAHPAAEVAPIPPQQPQPWAPAPRSLQHPVRTLAGGAGCGASSPGPTARSACGCEPRSFVATATATDPPRIGDRWAAHGGHNRRRGAGGPRRSLRGAGWGGAALGSGGVIGCGGADDHGRWDAAERAAQGVDPPPALPMRTATTANSRLGANPIATLYAPTDRRQWRQRTRRRVCDVLRCIRCADG